MKLEASLNLFLSSVLEDEGVKAAMAQRPDLKEAGRKKAEQILATGKKKPYPEDGLLPLFVFGYLTESALTQNRLRGIPDEITLETLKDVNLWVKNYQKKTGKPGLCEFPWLARHFSGKLFRLGRLQYCLKEAPEGLSGEEWVADVHIPAGEPLTLSSVKESMDLARVFFTRHFSDVPLHYFYCHSWLLSPVLAELLPRESNTVSFMELWEKIPMEGDQSASAIRFVFGEAYTKENLAQAPEDTGLRRKMKAFLLAGGEVDITGGVHPF